MIHYKWTKQGMEVNDDGEWLLKYDLPKESEQIKVEEEKKDEPKRDSLFGASELSMLQDMVTEFNENIDSYAKLKETGNSEGKFHDFYRGKWEAYNRAKNLLQRFLTWFSIDLNHVIKDEPEEPGNSDHLINEASKEAETMSGNYINEFLTAKPFLNFKAKEFGYNSEDDGDSLEYLLDCCDYKKIANILPIWMEQYAQLKVKESQSNTPSGISDGLSNLDEIIKMIDPTTSKSCFQIDQKVLYERLISIRSRLTAVISDADIKAWVDKVQPERGGYKNDYLFAAKAMRDGKIMKGC